METLFVLFVLGGSVFCALALRQQRQLARRRMERMEHRQKTLVRFTLEDLEPDDVVQFDNIDWIVVGIAKFIEGEYSWIEGRVKDGEQERWLVLSRRDPEHVIWGERIADPGVGTHPSECIEHAMHIYSLHGLGQAAIESAGRLGKGYPANQCRYWDYSGEGKGRLWIRGDGEQWVYFKGERALRHFFDTLPAK